jgi:adenylylsulfate kinase-like enzyme
VLVLIRDTVISPDNPYSFMERANMIREVFTDSENVIINPIPDFEEIVYGRTPGWRVRSVDTGHEKISASAIRSNGRIIWLTGNSGSGKSTLADMLEPLIPGSIVLHGDEMRASISKYEGFGPLDRTRHCRRVGRLAGILAARGHTVLVAVIAPFHTLRVLAESDSGREITWIYVKRDSLDWGSERPYTPPVSPDFTVDTDLLTPEQAVEQILSALDVYPSDGYTGRREEIDGK